MRNRICEILVDDVLRKLTLVVNCLIYWDLNRTIVTGTEEWAPQQKESIFQDYHAYPQYFAHFITCVLSRLGQVKIPSNINI